MSARTKIKEWTQQKVTEVSLLVMLPVLVYKLAKLKKQEKRS